MIVLAVNKLIVFTVLVLYFGIYRCKLLESKDCYCMLVLLLHFKSSRGRKRKIQKRLCMTLF